MRPFRCSTQWTSSLPFPRQCICPIQSRSHCGSLLGILRGEVEGEVEVGRLIVGRRRLDNEKELCLGGTTPSFDLDCDLDCNLGCNLDLDLDLDFDSGLDLDLNLDLEIH